ncbi:hypothetical protein K438DRAFT_1852428 [Mycena galopus ATCC 62051]|nr:hypothetical protein K438DRAFT_1852428 [Mycena galopus ATCC 62051]
MLRPRNREGKVVRNQGKADRVVAALESRESRKATSSRMGRVENKMRDSTEGVGSGGVGIAESRRPVPLHKISPGSRVEDRQNGRVESSETNQKGRVKVGAD